MRRNVIIDCDPGHDDAIAIIVALANSEKLNVLGITTVAGNTTLDNATKNALRVLEICGKDIPVSMGFMVKVVWMGQNCLNRSLNLRGNMQLSF